MSIENENAEQTIEQYLGRLRARLRGMNRDDAREIVAELRGHITDRATANGELTPTTVGAALAALGSPEELASQYMAEHLMARAESSRSPFRILESLFRWASLSIVGFLVLLASMLGYLFGLTFILCAVFKPFHPGTAGLWLLPGDEISFRMGFGTVPADGRDLLGWWIVPLGLIVGLALVALTTRFSLWCGRKYLTSRAVPRRG
jgi:hypothetical protein